MNPNRVLSLSLSVFTALIVACSAGAGGTGSGGTTGGTPLTPEQLMAYAGPAPKNLNTLEGMWLSNSTSGSKMRMEVRDGTLTVAANCNGKTFGTSTQAQIGVGSSEPLSDGGTQRRSSFTVLGGIDLKVAGTGGSKGCYLKFPEGKASVWFYGDGAGFGIDQGFYIEGDNGVGGYPVTAFIKIGD